MKTKILFTFLLIAAMAYSASAITITISGGGKKYKFNYVKLDDKDIICKGVGSITCPIDFSVQSVQKTTHKVDAVVGFVSERVVAGERDGKTTFEEYLPVSWTTDKNDVITIRIDDDGKTVLQPYEEKE